MTIEAVHPVGAARLVSAVLKNALTGMGWYGNGDPARMRVRADMLLNIVHNGVVDHYANVYPIDRDRIANACILKAAELREEAARISGGATLVLGRRHRRGRPTKLTPELQKLL